MAGSPYTLEFCTIVSQENPDRLKSYARQYGICIVTFAPPVAGEFSKSIFPLCFLAMESATYRPIP